MPEERFERVRPGRPEDLDEIAALAYHSFPAPDRDVAWWREQLAEGPHGESEATWVAEEGGRVVGACLLLPLRQWISGVAMPMTGLGLVSVSPTHRRRGLAGRMVGAGLRHARERGDVVSALYPFRMAYYEGLGYGAAGEAHQYRLPPRALPEDAGARLGVSLVRTAEDRADLRDVYARAAPLQTGQVERTERSWAHLLRGDDRVAALYRGAEGTVEGYALIRYRPDLPAPERYLEVEERMWITPAARRGIYAWLASMGDQWPELLYRAHPDERFGAVVAEPRLPPGSAPGWNLWIPSATLLLGPMFRLLDVGAALRMRKLSAGEGLTLRLEVEDEQIPENRGPWRVSLGESSAVVEEGPGPVDVAMRLPVRILSRIFIGALSPSQAVADGAARIDDPRALSTLDAAFRLPRPWTFERF